MPTLPEWEDKYRKESPYPYYEESGYERIFDPDKGFLTFQIQQGYGVFFIQEICGDMKHWMEVARTTAKERGCSSVMGVTKRNPKAVTRLLKVDYVGHIFCSEVR